MPRGRKPKFSQLGMPGIVEDSGAVTDKIETYNSITASTEIAHALRTINAGNLEMVNQELKSKYFDLGWTLFNTHFGGMQPEGMIIIYVFVR